MIKTKKKPIKFHDLTERKKDNILTYIRSKGVSIKQAAIDLNVTSTTINKIFTERYGKRDQKNKIYLANRKEYHRKYYQENKFKQKYMALRKKKEKVKIMGKSYKVDIPISDTLKAMSEALRSHEVALLTWVHKDYEANEKFEKKEIDAFRDSLRDYCSQIPESENILKRMQELDKQLEEDIKNKEKKEEKGQNKQEKDSGAKE